MNPSSPRKINVRIAIGYPSIATHISHGVKPVLFKNLPIFTEYCLIIFRSVRRAFPEISIIAFCLRQSFPDVVTLDESVREFYAARHEDAHIWQDAGKSLRNRARLLAARRRRLGPSR